MDTDIAATILETLQAAFPNQRSGETLDSVCVQLHEAETDIE